MEPTLEIRPVTNEAEWAMARAIRQQVFVEEQHCAPEEEWDAYDERSRHVLGRVGGEPVATARWRTVPYETQRAAKIERVAVRADFRGRGYGRTLVRCVMADARHAGFHTFLLHAQAHLADFYMSLGFEPVSARFVEAGIPHVKMVRRDARGRHTLDPEPGS